MMIINKPEIIQIKESLEEVKCYLCNTVMKVHPMTNMNSPWLKDCELHKKKENEDE